MKDKSIDQDERFLETFVFTYDQNPCPSVIDIHNHLTCKELFPESLPSRLQEIKDLETLAFPELGSNA